MKRSPDATERVDPEGPHRLVTGFRLSVVAGPDVGKSWASTGGRTVIGKDASCQLILTDKSVSQFHCEILQSQMEGSGPPGGSLTVRDLGSRNGTALDGVPITSAPLTRPVTLTLGRSQIRFETGTQPVKVPLSTQ